MIAYFTCGPNMLTGLAVYFGILIVFFVTLAFVILTKRKP